MLIQAGSCRDEPDPAFDFIGMFARAEVGDGGIPGGGGQQSQQHPQGGRLASAVGAQQPVDFTGRNAKRDPIDRPQLAAIREFEDFRQVVDGDHDVGGSSRANRHGTGGSGQEGRVPRERSGAAERASPGHSSSWGSSDVGSGSWRMEFQTCSAQALSVAEGMRTVSTSAWPSTAARPVSSQ